MKSTDVKENCEQSVLYCYVQELKTVVEELSLLDDQYITDQIENQILHIERNGHLETKTTDSCKKCEEYEEKPIEEFKKGLNTLTQKMQDQGKR
ncbi:interleukin-15 [Mixophyes fleayi]|uniref:interleukin-15 n=1 Tax=Mixophyes fleayi TaxID=3061075 RepID=UPI003F4DF33C